MRWHGPPWTGVGHVEPDRRLELVVSMPAISADVLAGTNAPHGTAEPKTASALDVARPCGTGATLSGEDGGAMLSR